MKKKLIEKKEMVPFEEGKIAAQDYVGDVYNYEKDIPRNPFVNEFEKEMWRTIMVCEHCGKNGDEVSIEGYSKSMFLLDKYGETTLEKSYDYGTIDEWYCTNCDGNTGLITLLEYERKKSEETDGLSF